MDRIRVSLNDEPLDVAPDATLAQMLDQISAQISIEPPPARSATAGPEDGGTARRFVIAVNKEFVPRADYASVVLKDGDEIDLVRPVWGG